MFHTLLDENSHDQERHVGEKITRKEKLVKVYVIREQNYIDFDDVSYTLCVLSHSHMSRVLNTLE
jgi:hypothetical protein